jgi:carbon storage regulator CsrA
MLILSRKKNESIVIGDGITLTVLEIRGDKVRLGFVPSSQTSVHRAEVWEAIHGGREKEPSAPVQLDPAWLAWNDRTIPRLARAIRDEHAWDRLPVLADALEDAGCTDPVILAHCRAGSEHRLSCWVIDLVLARE